MAVLALVLMSCGNDGKPTATADVNNTSTKPKTITNQPTVTNDKVSITAKDASVKSGSEVCINVQVANFNEIISMQYATVWDTKALRFKGCLLYTSDAADE